MKCANCDNDAQYTFADPGTQTINFCSNCLPTWLHDRAQAGHFPVIKDAVTEPVVEEVVVEPKSAAKRKRTAEDKPAVEDSAEETSEAEVPADENN